MLKPSKQFLYLLPLLAVLLSACGEKEPVKPVLAASAAPVKDANARLEANAAPTKDAEARLEAELMSAVFGKQYRSASRDALANMPDVGNRKEVGSYLVMAAAHRQLPDGKMALVLNGGKVDQSGNPVSDFNSLGLLSVYLLQKIDGQWKVLKKHENIAALDYGADPWLAPVFQGNSFGEVEWVNLAPDRPGMVIHNGRSRQGTTYESIALFDLKTESMHDLSGDGILLHFDDDGMCGLPLAECWNVSGKYRFVPGKPGSPYQDLLIEFSGEKSTLIDKGDVQDEAQDGKAADLPGADGSSAASSAGEAKAEPKSEVEPERSVIKINSRARYAFDGKYYRLVEGANPAQKR